jgi:hypothetical protein
MNLEQIVFDKLEKLTEKKSKFRSLKEHRQPLTDEERKECLNRKAVWHFIDTPSPAVWKSIKDGETTYITNTHRAYNTASTLSGAIDRFHNYIKGTA